MRSRKEATIQPGELQAQVLNRLGLLNTTAHQEHTGRVHSSNKLGSKARKTEGGSGNRNSRPIADLGNKIGNRNKDNSARRHGNNSRRRERRRKGRMNNSIEIDLIHLQIFSINTKINRELGESNRHIMNACGTKGCEENTRSEYEKKKSIENMMRLDIKGRGPNGRKSLKGGNRNGVTMMQNKIERIVNLMIIIIMNTLIEQPRICGGASFLHSVLSPSYYGTSEEGLGDSDFMIRKKRNSIKLSVILNTSKG